MRVLFLPMGWRVVYIESTEYLSLYLDNIKISKTDDDILIPLSDIHTLILDNYQIVLSVHLINALTDNNINIVICGVDHLPQSLVIPKTGHQQGLSILKKQLSWQNSVKGKIHQEIITSKIKQQLKLLEYHKKDSETIEKLKTYISEVLTHDNTNREGLSAKMYFRALFGTDFKRFNDDVVNAGMNYGYAILRSQISKCLISKGINTAIGLFHKGPTNQFNFSDDIIEPFRPLIDDWVYQNLLNEAIFKREHRIELIKCTTKDVLIKNTKQTLFNAINIFVDSVINFMDTNGKFELLMPELIFS